MKRHFPLLAVLAFAQCGDDPTDPGLTAFITAVTGAGGSVSVVAGTPPAKIPGMPDPQIFGPNSVTPGGTVQFDLSAAGITFTRVYVQIVGMERYYQLDLPAAITTGTFTITMAPTIPVSNFTFVFGLGASFGQNYGSHIVNVN